MISFSSLTAAARLTAACAVLAASFAARAAEPVDAPVKAQAAPAASATKAVRGAVITMGDREDRDMVGVYMTAEQLRRMIPMLEEEEVDVVVFRFYSGGGYLSEIMKLSDVLYKDYRQKFHTVAWIESAISAAAMTAHTIPDIYFTSQANYGACTAFAGSFDRPVVGVELERVLHDMEIISERGNHDPKIARAMQISSDDQDIEALKIAPPSGALSANVDPRTGDVTFYQDASSGSIVLNPHAGRRILTFNSDNAEKVGFSKGTANTLDQLTPLLGYKEIQWVGEKVKNVNWPVSKAEKSNIAFRNRTRVDEDMYNNYFREFNQSMAMAQSAADRTECLKFTGRAKRSLDELEKMIRNNPNLAMTVLNRSLEDAKKLIADERKRLREFCR